MADVKELILTIVRPLVSQPEAVSLEIEESTDFLEYNLTVAKEDIDVSLVNKGVLQKQFGQLFIVYVSMVRKGPFKYS